MLLTLGSMAVVLSNGAPINSDLFSLVDRQGGESAPAIALTRMRALSEQRQTWIAAHPNQDIARRAAILLRAQLSKSYLFQPEIESPSISEITDFYSQFVDQLADEDSLKMGRSRDIHALVNRVERTLHTGTIGLPGLDLEQDPFLLQAHFIRELVQIPEPFTIDSGMLASRINGRWNYLLPIALRGNAFDFAYQQELKVFSEQTVEAIQAETGAEISSVGAIDFATANRELAVMEVGLIGGASLLLIAALLFGTFFHARPYLAIGVTILSGIAGGASICILAFGSIHVLTLVAGCSLIGISVDYSFHLLADSFRATGRAWRVEESLEELLPAITLGLLTSLAGFLGLYASGFKGLQEIAVFCASGLVVAYISLIATYPFLLGGWSPKNVNPLGLRAASAWVAVWQPRRNWLIVLASGVAASVLLIPNLNSTSDIRMLAAESDEIDALVARSATLTATLLDSRFIVVEANSLESLLQREEALRPILQTLISQGGISHFNQLSQFVPSQKRQQEALMLRRGLYLGPESSVGLLSARIGLRDDVVESLRTSAKSGAQTPPLLVDDMLSSPLAPLASSLFLGSVDGGVASVVTLAGVADPALVADMLAGLEQITFVDSVAEISQELGLYADNAVRGLVIALSLISLLMTLRFGIVEGALTILVPLVAFGITILALWMMNEPVNLFHIVGLALVLGMGMDYTLFLKAGGTSPHTMLAVLLAAITTQCAFGLLGFSDVRALRSFGWTVALGTLVTFILAPMACRPRPSATV
jgi:predicted exporter